MAALNQGKIIKGLEQLAESPDPRNFFFDFLKVFGFSKTRLSGFRRMTRPGISQLLKVTTVLPNKSISGKRLTAISQNR